MSTVSCRVHSETSLRVKHDVPMLWTSKAFSVAVDIMGNISVGSSFSRKFSIEPYTVARMNDNVLSRRLVTALTKKALNMTQYEMLPANVYTDLGYSIDSVFLAFDTEKAIHSLYVVCEGVRYEVVVDGERCKCPKIGMIDTVLLFCRPVYFFNVGQGVVTVVPSFLHVDVLCALLSGCVFTSKGDNTEYWFVFGLRHMSQIPSYTFGSNTLISELRVTRRLCYVK